MREKDPTLRPGFRAAFASLLFVASAGCTSEYHLMITPGMNVTRAPDDCSFEVSKGLPAALDYVEIGRLEAQFFPVSDLEKLKTVTHREVCLIGGDLLVGEWDGNLYSSAIVYRRRPSPVSTPVAVKPIPSVAAPSPPPGPATPPPN